MKYPLAHIPKDRVLPRILLKFLFCVLNGIYTLLPDFVCSIGRKQAEPFSKGAELFFSPPSFITIQGEGRDIAREITGSGDQVVDRRDVGIIYSCGIQETKVFQVCITISKQYHKDHHPKQLFKGFDAMLRCSKNLKSPGYLFIASFVFLPVCFSKKDCHFFKSWGWIVVSRKPLNYKEFLVVTQVYFRHLTSGALGRS